MLWFIIPTIVLAWIVTGAFAATVLGRKFENGCKRSNHAGCFHNEAAPVSGALWPVAIPFWLIVGSIGGLIYVGTQAGRTRAQRAESVERRRDAVKQFREGQIEAANNELERQLYGEQECKHCRCTVFKKNGMWIAKVDGSNGCHMSPRGYGGAHQVPDAIDAKLKDAVAEAEARKGAVS